MLVKQNPLIIHIFLNKKKKLFSGEKLQHRGVESWLNWLHVWSFLSGDRRSYSFLRNLKAYNEKDSKEAEGNPRIQCPDTRRAVMITRYPVPFRSHVLPCTPLLKGSEITCHPSHCLCLSCVNFVMRALHPDPKIARNLRSSSSTP